MNAHTSILFEKEFYYKGGIMMSEISPQVLKTLKSDRVLNGINQGKSRIHSFNADFTEYSPKFTGKFTVHYPSQFERLRIGTVKSQLLGGVQAVDQHTDNLAHIMATLEIVLDEKPDWFDVYSEDLEYPMLEDVFLEYLNWVDTFRVGDRGNKPGADSENGNGTDTVVDPG